MEEQREALWERLKQWQQASETRMTKDRYLAMKAELGEEPIWEECPPGDDDFPYIVVDAINTFNSLGDRIYPEIGYTGKDYTNVPIYLEYYMIQDDAFFIDILLRLDDQAIKTSQDSLKREMDRLKRKHG